MHQPPSAQGSQSTPAGATASVQHRHWSAESESPLLAAEPDLVRSKNAAAHEDVAALEDELYKGRCCWCCCGWCTRFHPCCIVGVTLGCVGCVILCILAIVLPIVFFWQATAAVAAVSTATIGAAEVFLGGSALEALGFLAAGFGGAANIGGLTIGNPPKTAGKVFMTAGAVLLHPALRTVFRSPMEFNNIQFSHVHVWVKRKLGGSSNVATIVGFMNRAQIVASLPWDRLPEPDDMRLANALFITLTKFKFRHVSFKNIHVSLCLEPYCSGGSTKTKYGVPECVLKDVGGIKDIGPGIFLYSVVDMFVRAVVMATVQAAPDAMRADMLLEFGRPLWQGMDDVEVVCYNGTDTIEVQGWQPQVQFVLQTRPDQARLVLNDASNFSAAF